MWDIRGMEFVSIDTMTMAEALVRVQSMRAAGHKIRLIIEDARLRRAWYGGMDAKQARYGAGVREGVGSVKRDCALWQEWVQLHGIPWTMISPQAKGAKIGAAAFAALTGWHGRTSEHARDAAMLVWRAA